MATYDLQEQEQIEELKTWWRMHGNTITAIFVAMAVAVVGWQGWQWWQSRQAAQAAQIYAGLQQALMQRDVKQVRQHAGELIDRHAGTTYAGMAALLAGKVLAESGDLKSAQAQFGWATDKAKDAGLRELARLRQAIVLADDQSPDAALKLLTNPPTSALRARYFEVRGDILLSQGNTGEARQAYEEALKALEESRKASGLPAGPYADILAAKRDAAAGGQS